MATSTALNQLQEQIEAVRREAYAAGYAAAMESIRDFVTKGGAPSAPAQADAAAPVRRGRPPGRSAKAASQSAEASPVRARGRRRKSAEESGAARTARSAGARAARGRGAGARPQRGSNARLIEEILQQIAPRAARPAEIRTALRDKGVEMAFTSIRHALGQLETRNAVEQAGDKMWRARREAGAG